MCIVQLSCHILFATCVDCSPRDFLHEFNKNFRRLGQIFIALSNMTCETVSFSENHEWNLTNDRNSYIRMPDFEVFPHIFSNMEFCPNFSVKLSITNKLIGILTLLCNISIREQNSQIFVKKIESFYLILWARLSSPQRLTLIGGKCYFYHGFCKRHFLISSIAWQHLTHIPNRLHLVWFLIDKHLSNQRCWFRSHSHIGGEWLIDVNNVQIVASRSDDQSISIVLLVWCVCLFCRWSVIFEKLIRFSVG